MNTGTNIKYGDPIWIDVNDERCYTSIYEESVSK